VRTKDEINLSNLFSLYNLIALKNDSVIINKNENFSIIVANNSIWPNTIFKVCAKELTDEIITEIEKSIKSYSVKPLLLLENEADSLARVRKNGFLPIDQWVCMYHEEGLGSKKSIVNPSVFSISLLRNNVDLNEWVNLVSESMFNNKKLDESIFKLLMDSGIELVVVKLENKIIGSAMIYFDENNIAGIYLVSVSKAHRKQGIGKQIINFCFECIRLHKVSYCVLQATRQAVSLYENLEFKKTGTFNLYLKVK
jgi:N-acetylglutamate synthase-like GNAT family acetyltransferase